jgi:hypothetical protein
MRLASRVKKCHAQYGIGAGLGRGMLNVTRVLAALAATGVLLAPAIWNRFPLLQWDTGGYLARWFEGYLVPSRSVVYGLFLTAGWRFDFWPVVVAQALATLWVLWLLLRTHDLEPSPLAFAGLIVALSALTTLPWIVAILLTDIFAGLAVLGLYLLLFQSHRLCGRERAGLGVLVAFATATHSATLAVVLAVLVAGAAASFIRRDIVPGRSLARASAAVVLSVVLVFAANYLLARRLAWTPGGYGIAFGRLLQDGLVKRYLDRHCPQAQFKLCPYRDELPATADGFLWGQSVFDRLGRFAGLGAEMESIVLGSIAEEPVANLQAALTATARQLVTVAGGEGVLTDIWHTYGMIETFTPSVAPAMRAARQQHGEIDFAAMNAVQVPIALASLALLPFIVLIGWRRDAYAGLGRLAATVILAVVVNAAVCSILSGPHPRYGARLIWLASLTVMLVPIRRTRLARPADIRGVSGIAAPAANPP